MPDSSPAVTTSRRLWQRRVRDPIVAQLTQGMTPEKIAQTIAVGSCFALFPVLGTTTILCFLVGVALRLNQAIIQLINQALWPVHLSTIYLCVRLGEKLFHAPPSPGIRHLNSLFWNDPAMFLHRFGITAVHAVTAWALLAPVYIAVVYYVTLPIMKEIVRIRAEAAAAKAPDHPVP